MQRYIKKVKKLNNSLTFINFNILIYFILVL